MSDASQPPNLKKSTPAAPPAPAPRIPAEVKWITGFVLGVAAIVTATAVTISRHADKSADELVAPARQSRTNPTADRDRALLNQPNLAPQLVTFITPQGERLVYRTRQYEVACLMMLTGRTSLDFTEPYMVLTRNASGWTRLNVSQASGLRTELPPPSREQQNAALTFNVCGQFRQLPPQTPEDLNLDSVTLPNGHLNPQPEEDRGDDGYIGIGPDGNIGLLY